MPVWPWWPDGHVFCHDGSSILPVLDVDVVAEGSLQFAIEGIAVAGGRELAEHAADVLAQVEVLFFLHHFALYGEVEAAEVVEHHRMALATAICRSSVTNDMYFERSIFIIR